MKTVNKKRPPAACAFRNGCVINIEHHRRHTHGISVTGLSWSVHSLAAAFRIVQPENMALKWYDTVHRTVRDLDQGKHMFHPVSCRPELYSTALSAIAAEDKVIRQPSAKPFATRIVWTHFL